MTRESDFDRFVRLPEGLSIAAIKKSIDYIEKQCSDLADLYVEQKNVFSAIVGIFGAKALDTHSRFEKSRHSDIAQTRFPDLKLRGSGSKPKPEQCLESKASKRPWELQSHYNHTGWYIVWRYLVDPTCSIERDRSVVVWRVDAAFLTADDGKYEGSGAGSGRGGRTHTFGLKSARHRLMDCAVYSRNDIELRGGKPVVKNGQ